MKYYTSDLHLSHTNIIKYENRPFTSVEEMNNTIIDNINYRLTPDDELYILGDFTLEKNPHRVSELIKRIKCKKHLIIGNHDYFTRSKDLCSLFDSVSNYLEIEDEGRTVILFHYPIQNWNLKRYGSIHLYGHVHSKEELQLKEENAFNVGVDVNNFMPVTLEELLLKRGGINGYLTTK
ncbi:metallophosphoesterase [Candidatus Saccharibacteria bacterium]|nr:metallophosphoesterase [Candidatus Saccharibacteria bacterium]